MPQILFALAMVSHLIFLTFVLRLRLRAPEIIVCLLLLAMATDNAVLLLSDVALGTDLYYALSWLRYVAHVLVLPLLIEAARQVAVRAGVAWAAHQAVKLGAWLLVVAGIGFGVWTELLGLRFVEAELLDHVRLVSADAHPPFATIFTNIVVLIFGAAIWRSARWPWLFLAALAIFGINGATGASAYGLLFGNGAEVIFALGWVVTLYHFRDND